MDAQRLAEIERSVLQHFGAEGQAKILTRFIFATLPYANADLVRAFESLEKQRRLVVRYTEHGDDWLQLTPEGMQLVGLQQATGELPRVIPHPPKSST